MMAGMASSAKKARSREEETPVFSEERRVPLTKAARDAFLRALKTKARPNAAARAAARRYKQASQGAKKG
jgi:uncharacterized protein (DUF1778 family)